MSRLKVVFFPGLGKKWIPVLLLQTLPLLGGKEFEGTQTSSRPERLSRSMAGLWGVGRSQQHMVARCLQTCTGRCAAALAHCRWVQQTVLVFCAELNLALHNFLNEPAVCQGCAYLWGLPRAKKSQARSVAVKDLIGKEQKLPRSPLVQNYFRDQQFVQDEASVVKNNIFSTVFGWSHWADYFYLSCNWYPQELVCGGRGWGSICVTLVSAGSAFCQKWTGFWQLSGVQLQCSLVVSGTELCFCGCETRTTLLLADLSGTQKYLDVFNRYFSLWDF